MDNQVVQLCLSCLFYFCMLKQEAWLVLCLDECIWTTLGKKTQTAFEFGEELKQHWHDVSRYTKCTVIKKTSALAFWKCSLPFNLCFFGWCNILSERFRYLKIWQIKFIYCVFIIGKRATGFWENKAVNLPWWIIKILISASVFHRIC
jgi:hypothetical protein